MSGVAENWHCDFTKASKLKLTQHNWSALCDSNYKEYWNANLVRPGFNPNIVPPRFGQFKGMRATADDSYQDFCKQFLKCVVGHKQWRSLHLKQKFSEFVTVTDEAFALLVVLNSHKRWSELWVHQLENSKLGDPNMTKNC